MDERELSVLAESAEAEFMYRVETNAPPAMRDERGMAAERLGGGVALAMRHDPSGYWSKALGFRTVDRALMARLVAFYAAQGSAGAVVQPAPWVLPPDWEDIRDEFGLEGGSSWLQLWGAIDDVRPGPRDVEVVPVEDADAEAWALVVLGAFGMDGDLFGPMLAATVGHPMFRVFAAWVDGEIVGGGSLFLHDEVGVLNFTAVDPRHRNRGVQTALIAARVEAACALGCRLLTAQVDEPAPGARNPSLENLRRAGLQPLYQRRNWIWRPRT